MDFVSKNSEIFKDLCKQLEITNDQFIRTTEERHKAAAREIWKRLEDKGEIYFGTYEGDYCYDCEAFIPKSSQEDPNVCPIHHKPLTYIKEEGYFLRASKYGEWIEQHILNNPGFIFPKSSRDEILGRLKANPQRDISISRKSKGWGVPVPGNEEHVMYTWFDALINYWTPFNSGEFEEKYWPCDMHVIGKDIAYFHTVVWPIMLHAAGIPLPKSVHVHGMLVDADGKKMSKSLGNVVDPKELFEIFPNDSIRYYFYRHVSSGQDGRTSIDMMVERHNAELANTFGNLVNRAVKLSLKRIGEEVGDKGYQLAFTIDEDLRSAVLEAMETNMHHKALDAIWGSISKLNGYLNEKEPWRIKDDPEAFHEIMYNCLHGLYIIAHWLTPFLPYAADTIQSYLGTEKSTKLLSEFGKPTFKLTDPKPLFARVEQKKEESE